MGWLVEMRYATPSPSKHRILPSLPRDFTAAVTHHAAPADAKERNHAVGTANAAACAHHLRRLSGEGICCTFAAAGGGSLPRCLQLVSRPEGLPEGVPVAASC